MKRPQISVVVPSYRQHRTISRTVESLLRQDFSSYEVIIVDSSADQATEIIRNLCKRSRKLKMILLPERTIAAVQRKIGISYARADIIATIDTDCIAQSNWLSEISKRLSAGVQAIGGSFGNGNPESIVGWVNYLVEFSEFLPGSPACAPLHLASGNMAFYKKVPEQFGYYPPMHLGEDLVATQIWRQNGVRMLFDPAIRVDHINRERFIEALQHQNKLGFSSYVARNRYFVPKDFAAGHPLVFPCLWIYRLLAVGFRLIRWNRHELLIFIGALPLVILLLLAWNIGFIRGYEAEKKNTEPTN